MIIKRYNKRGIGSQKAELWRWGRGGCGKCGKGIKNDQGMLHAYTSSPKWASLLRIAKKENSVHCLAYSVKNVGADDWWSKTPDFSLNLTRVSRILQPHSQIHKRWSAAGDLGFRSFFQAPPDIYPARWWRSLLSLPDSFCWAWHSGASDSYETVGSLLMKHSILHPVPNWDEVHKSSWKRSLGCFISAPNFLVSVMSWNSHNKHICIDQILGILLRPVY